MAAARSLPTRSLSMQRPERQRPPFSARGLAFRAVGAQAVRSLPLDLAKPMRRAHQTFTSKRPPSCPHPKRHLATFRDLSAASRRRQQNFHAILYVTDSGRQARQLPFIGLLATTSVAMRHAFTAGLSASPRSTQSCNMSSDGADSVSLGWFCRTAITTSPSGPYKPRAREHIEGVREDLGSPAPRSG